VLTAALLGLVLGLRHAADPDHVVAVSTLAGHHGPGRRASLLGLAWGLGHSLTVVVAGGLLIVLGRAMPAGVDRGLEATVGAVLIGLGLANLRRAAARSGAAPERVRSGWRSFAVGCVHGLAGTAALALLALAAMPTPEAAVAYLAVFGAGTTAGMVAVSLGLGAPLGWLAARPGGARAVAATTGLFAVAFGGWMVWAAGVPGRL